jgi:hypothetical protein
VRAWEVLAQASATTTTAQAVGAQGGDSVSGVWVPLLSALLGAIVGGAATLSGSVLVNRWELRRTARFRMYEELLPRVKNETWPRFRWDGHDRELFEQSLDALERVGAIAGPLEWRCAAMARLTGQGYAWKLSDALRDGDSEAAFREDMEAEARRLDEISSKSVDEPLA